MISSRNNYFALFGFIKVNSRNILLVQLHHYITPGFIPLGTLIIFAKHLHIRRLTRS